MNELTAIGIDPGLTGALAIVRDGNVLNCLDMPVETGAGNRRRVSAALLAHLLREMVDRNGPCVAAVEAVAARPGQGVSSVFSFGRSLGVLEGVLAACAIPVAYYQPTVWKRALGLLGRPKDASLTRALELFPTAAPWLTRKKDHGRAEAILLAHSRLAEAGR